MAEEGNSRKNEIAVIRNDLGAMETQFKAALPAHIPPERFIRVVMTALQNNPDLINCDRRSLWNAAMKAAQDGLLPDGREGALVPFKGSVQWMPMILGLRKKVRNSGEIATWEAYVVFEKDHFEFELGDEPFIKHKPSLEEDRGKVIAAYSVATLKSGEKSREVMTIAELNKVRNVSNSKDNAKGPWKNWPEEMYRKTVARRHSKQLPMSSDLDDLIRRDDELYDPAAEADGGGVAAGKITLADRLAALGTPIPGDDVPLRQIENGNGGDEVEHDPKTGEVREEEGDKPEPEPAGEKKPAARKKAEPKPAAEAVEAQASTDAGTATNEERREETTQNPPAVAGEADNAPPPTITPEGVKQAKFLAETLSTTNFPNGVIKGFNNFVSDKKLQPGSLMLKLSEAIRDAHLSRVRAELSIAEADNTCKAAITAAVEGRLDAFLDKGE